MASDIRHEDADAAAERTLAAYAGLRGKTAPLLLAERAEREPDTIAYRAKHLGIYHERSWRDFRDRVARCAEGLRRLGLAHGERVAIMGEACEEWVIADLAAQAAGAITYGIYPTSSVSELAYQMKSGGAAFFVAEDQEYVDKILPLIDELPALRWVIVVDVSAMFMVRHPKLTPFDRLLRLGEEAGADGASFRALVDALDPRSPAFIVYTSGTTSQPKGAVIAHGKHLAAAYSLVDRHPPLQQTQRTVIYLPLCHVLGRDVAITLPLMTGLIPHYGESVEDLAASFFEVAPTVLFTVPRYLQKFASQILVGMHNTSPLKAGIYALALAIGRAHLRRLWDGQAGPAGRLVYRLAHAVAFRPVLNKLGFDQLGLVVVGGAAMPPETTAFWQIHGVDVVEVYGQTEVAGAVIASQPSGFPRPGDVGRPPVGWKVELGEEAEILVDGPDIFEGYWQDPEATRQIMASAGRLHTGDVGAFRDGQLRIVDRARDFIVTSGGKTLSPTAIENALRASAYVSEAVVFGHNRKYVTALIEIDAETVADWARRQGVAYTGFASLIALDAVQRLIGQEVDTANARLGRVEQIKAFRILPKLLDPEEEGEPVTPTRKVKRRQMHERFRDLVESMYADDEERLLAEGVGDVLAHDASG
ncbi:MAG: AMP-dependent synthetase/ligase [Stellaceae bacterium]